jgi:hypothetical protein
VCFFFLLKLELLDFVLHYRELVHRKYVFNRLFYFLVLELLSLCNKLFLNVVSFNVHQTEFFGFDGLVVSLFANLCVLENAEGFDDKFVFLLDTEVVL